jgi:hypothetical protein
MIEFSDRVATLEAMIRANAKLFDALRAGPSAGPRVATRPGSYVREKSRKRRRSGRPRPRFSSAWFRDDRPSLHGSPESMRVAWSRLISRNGPWEWFVTLTFNRDLSDSAARRFCGRWLAVLRQAARDHASESGRRVSWRWVRATEYTCRGRVHLHLLLAADGALAGLHRFSWARRWESVGSWCGVARILPVVQAAARYVSKYAGKGGRLDIGGALLTRRLPPILARGKEGAAGPGLCSGTRPAPGVPDSVRPSRLFR